MSNRYANESSAQFTAHASVADVPVLNVKDLDLNQGDTIGQSSFCLCVTYNVFGMTFFCLTVDVGTSAINLLPPMRSGQFFYLRTTLIIIPLQHFGVFLSCFFSGSGYFN